MTIPNVRKYISIAGHLFIHPATFAVAASISLWGIKRLLFRPMSRGICKLLLVVALTALAVPARAQRCPGTGEAPRPDLPVGQLIEDLRSDYWPRVRTAKLRLESRQAEAIPALVELAQSDQYVKLRETWDLIYPGASTFYGHGYVLDYDIDWLSVRAGWVLEEMSFQRFGFTEGVIDHDELLQATILGKADSALEDVVRLRKDLEAKLQQRKAAAKRAEAWWQVHAKTWNRMDAIVEALNSADLYRTTRALNWLLNGETRCDQFDRPTVEKKILPIVRKFTRSGKEDLRNYARYLLEVYQRERFYQRKTTEACY